MKYIILLVLILFSVSHLAYAASDSRNIKPPNLTGQYKILVNVLHYVPSMTFNNTSNYKCPGNSTLISSKFYPTDTSFAPCTNANTAGAYVYTCSQNFWSNDPDYKTLRDDSKTIPWTPCPDNRSTSCSIKMTKPNLILFKIKVPAPDRQGYNKLSGSRRPNGYVSFYDFDFWASFAGYTMYKFAWAKRDTNSCPYVEKTYIYNYYPTAISMGWIMYGRAGKVPSEQYYSSAMGETGVYGTFTCGSNAPTYNGLFYMTINPSLSGKTCTITCTGYWDFTPDTWYSDRALVDCED